MASFSDSVLVFSGGGSMKNYELFNGTVREISLKQLTSTHLLTKADVVKLYRSIQKNNKGEWK